eukprot:4687748-Lingulodinium_polyedra.AAC.1
MLRWPSTWRAEKKPRQYQSDAAVQQAYFAATAGGGLGAEAGEEAGASAEKFAEGPQDVGLEHFQPA